MVVTSRVTVVVVVTGGGSSAQPINASGNASEQMLIFIKLSFFTNSLCASDLALLKTKPARAQVIAQSRF